MIDASDVAAVRSSVRTSTPAARWPNGKRAACTLTFDVDAESALLAEDENALENLTVASEWRHCVKAGLVRIRDVLCSEQVSATFYVPGWVAETYPDDIRPLIDEGHEIGHHGYLHRNPLRLSVGDQREEFERGLSALSSSLGVEPRGYRAPFFSLTRATAELVLEHGLLYDSSCMGDDSVYCESIGERPLLEFPVHWNRDDGAYLAWDYDGRVRLNGPRSWYKSWRHDASAVLLEGSHVTLTMHPHWTGRPQTAHLLRKLIDYMQRNDMWIATHADVSQLIGEQAQQATASRPGWATGSRGT